VATIEILSWSEVKHEHAHAREELLQRLRRGVKASPQEIRRLARRINVRELLCLENVYEEGVFWLTQMLQWQGADIRVSVEDGNSEKLFKRVPPR